MFDKIGLSLAHSGHFEIHILGFRTTKEYPNSHVFFYPHKYFTRLSPYRLLIPWLVLRKLLRLKPDLVIITTHELLLTGFLYKIISRARLIYDVQENYFLNILLLPSFPRAFRPFLAFYVRLKERFFSVYVDHFFLAEAGYEKELPFIGEKFTILENKTIRPPHIKPKLTSGETIRLLFSGTLDEATGVFVAIQLCKELHRLDHQIRLLLIGYCSTPHTLKKIKNAIDKTDFIELNGGDRLVPHEEILYAIQSSHAGIIAYLPNRVTQNSIPTKLFEYLGNRLPLLIVDHPPWTEKCKYYNAGITFDHQRIDGPKILHELKTRKFYSNEELLDVYWESEEKKLLSCPCFDPANSWQR